MKLLLILGISFAIFALLKSFLAKLRGPVLPRAEAARRVAAGQALLIDVRERNEWASGVASPAYLAPLSDLQGPRRKWGLVLEELGHREALVYCASGTRSAQAAALLRRAGHKAQNIGGFRDWQRAGLPVRGPEDPATLT